MAGSAIKAGEAYLTLAVRDQGFRSSLNRSLGRIAAFGRTLRSIGSLGFGGLSGFQQLLFSIAGSTALAWPVKLAADLELAVAAFTALTGSADKAKAILDELQLFAPIAGQTFEQLQHAARALLNYGLAAEQVVPVVRSLAAISGGNADSMDRLSIAFGQVAAKGKLAAEEVRQMVNAGFSPLQEISRTTGRSFRQVVADMEAGAISVNQVIGAFESATSTGGRFGNLLRALANTAKGQFAILRTSIAIAVRPLGDALLPAITQLLRRMNALIPAFADFVKANAGIAQSLGAIVASTAVFLGTLFSIGVAIQVSTFALAGLSAAIGALLSPIGLTVGLFAASTAAMIRFSGTAKAVVSFLTGRFLSLLDIVGQTFSGISDAIAGGDIQAATVVFWASLRLLWAQGTRDIAEYWFALKDVFIRTTIDMVFAGERAFLNFKFAVLKIWASIRTELEALGIDVAAFFLKLGRTDDQKRAIDALSQLAKVTQASQAQQELDNIEKRKQAELAAAAQVEKAARDAQAAGFNADVAGAAKERQAAQKAFEVARRQAALARGVPADQRLQLQNAVGNAGFGGFESRTSFGGRGVEQLFGASKADPVPRQQLIEARKTTKLLERIERKRAFDLRVGNA